MNHNVKEKADLFNNSSNSSMRFQGFKITGTGSQFLKCNRSFDNPENLTLDQSRKSDDLNLKGILRDSSLTHMKYKSSDTKTNEDLSEERKSVRFDIDLNSEIKSKVEISDSTYDFQNLEDVCDDEEVLESDKKPSSSEESNDSESSSSSSSEVESNAEINVVNYTEENKTPPIHYETLEDVINKEKEQYRLKMVEELEKLKTVEEANLNSELNKEKDKYIEMLNEHKRNSEENFRKETVEIKENYRIKLEEMKADLIEDNKKQFEIYKESLLEDFNKKVKEITDEHKSTMTTLQKNYDEIVEELERDLKTEEELLKKEHVTNLTEMKIKMSHELEMEKQRMRDTGEDRLYEKIRCEKRLLEDKYKCLKEKYMRLKNDVRISLERRKKRREQQVNMYFLVYTYLLGNPNTLYWHKSKEYKKKSVCL